MVICREVSTLKNEEVLEEMKKQYSLTVDETMVTFWKENNGGIPYKKEFCVDGYDYEVRYFLSLNDDDYNSIYKPMDSFQKETNGKTIPLAKDLADNYFCMHIETGSIYFWDSEDDGYYKIAESFEEFINYLK